jgi:hypothetical protein
LCCNGIKERDDKLLCNILAAADGELIVMINAECFAIMRRDESELTVGFLLDRVLLPCACVLILCPRLIPWHGLHIVALLQVAKDVLVTLLRDLP